jgi:hypothetical protein
MSDQEPDMLGEHPGSDRHSDQHAMEAHQHDEDDPAVNTTVPEDFDIEAPTEAGDGEPVHHNAGGEVGEGAD